MVSENLFHQMLMLESLHLVPFDICLFCCYKWTWLPIWKWSLGESEKEESRHYWEVAEELWSSGFLSLGIWHGIMDLLLVLHIFSLKPFSIARKIYRNYQVWLSNPWLNVSHHGTDWKKLADSLGDISTHDTKMLLYFVFYLICILSV